LTVAGPGPRVLHRVSEVAWWLSKSGLGFLRR
jgi:hypothetical protein